MTANRETQRAPKHNELRASAGRPGRCPVPSTSTDAYWRITNTQRRQSIQRRQAEAVRLDRAGLETAEIARRLGVQPETVARYLREA